VIHETKHCRKCDIIKKSDEFYRRRKGTDLSAYCKACSNTQTVERQRSFKERCVAYKGGKCEVCGYSKYYGAIEFHHKDPTRKDFSVSHARLTTFSEKIEKELDKCMILCANCHREEHARIKKII
jgi:predicted HNH restriction endonuclease